MGLVEAIVLGIVQGLTEWLPISSTAHLRIVPALLGWSDPGASFTAVIQIGTMLAAIIFFRTDLASAIRGWLASFRGDRSQDAMMGWAIFVGTLPIVILGLIFKDQIKSDSVRSLHVIAIALIVMGLLMWIADFRSRRARNLNAVTVRDGVWVGIWQAIALIPGASRSGSTITGALFAGFDRASAARFSFLLSLPSILAAGLFQLVEARKEILGPQLGSTIVATIVSFAVGYGSIAFLMRYLQTKSTLLFVVYRVALGCILLLLLQQGILT